MRCGFRARPMDVERSCIRSAAGFFLFNDVELGLYVYCTAVGYFIIKGIMDVEKSHCHSYRCGCRVYQWLLSI